MGLARVCWHMPPYTPKPLGTPLGVMTVSLMEGDRDAVLLSTCSLGLALTLAQPWHCGATDTWCSCSSRSPVGTAGSPASSLPAPPAPSPGRLAA